MKRRHFLGAAAASLAATAWPAFIQNAFGDGAACDADGNPKAAAPQAAVVAAAFRRAQQAKRPLLVLVIPADDGKKYERGRAFGELLNHGADKDLAPLADAEVLCATLADLKKLVPNAGDGEPMMLLVKTDKVPAAVTPLDVELPDYDGPNQAGGGDWEEMRKQEDKISAKRISAMGGLLRNALGSDERKVAERAAGVRAKLVKKPPVGASWANGHGCGTTIEGVEDNMVVGCGMGHVPAKSGRFLYFFSLDRRRI
jgi:hypothetical protein